MNILVVDDDVGLVAQLAKELGACGHVVTCVHDAPEALAEIRRQPFDAIVLDRLLPTMDGLTVVEQVRGTGVNTPIFLLTALGAVAERIKGLDAGADDYLVKPIEALELNARLHAARRGRQRSAPGTETIRAGDVVVSPASHRAWYGGTPVDLSKGEFGVLVELARHAGATVTRAMLYERLWGTGFNPVTNIAEAHIRRLRHKLVATGRGDPILTVRGIGYKLKP